MELPWTRFVSCVRGTKRIMTRIRRDYPTKLWEDLPSELLSLIVDRLGMVDLLSFRGVCKSWRASASLATAEVESSPDRHPWFLVHQDGKPHCLLLNDKHEKRHISIPELEKATCLASSQGWLLVTKQDSVFFFCPFSRSRIDLPRLPLTPSDQVAAFSAPPTCKDCVVCVPNRDKDSGLELLLLSRAQGQWTRHDLGIPHRYLGGLTSALFYGGNFCFRDNGDRYVKFCPRDKARMWYRVLSPTERVCPDTERVPFIYKMKLAQDYKKDITDWLGGEVDVSVATCGTIVAHKDKNDVCVMNETARSGGLRGIWLHPRFFELPRDQTW